MFLQLHGQRFHLPGHVIASLANDMISSELTTTSYLVSPNFVRRASHRSNKLVRSPVSLVVNREGEEGRLLLDDGHPVDEREVCLPLPSFVLLLIDLQDLTLPRPTATHHYLSVHIAPEAVQLFILRLETIYSNDHLSLQTLLKEKWQ
jgi:hypothetical protein